MSNRLAHEESPYLLQHAHNPVDWYPWGQEAFDKAKELDLPIFLSIGYSTCHWCHVMERESFESQEVAEVMNQDFVNIKVDREERPDVDKVYMTYVQAITGGGGWPMSVFLTPTLEPIVGGTYFPPQDAYGRPGFKTVLRKVSAAWQKDKQALLAQGNHIMESIENAINSQESGGGGAFDAKAAETAIQRAYEQLKEKFDEQNGGFTTAPKFPRVSEINLVLVHHLMREAKDSVEAGRALHMAELTLQKMAAGGIHDHIGGGFARYSVDEIWHVPHFEKMLYDNPQIVQSYLAAFQTTGKSHYASVARSTLDYLLRDMRHPEGGFYSAEDADSLDKEEGIKKEGAFYVWKLREVEDLLGGAGSPQARLFVETYHVLEEGNATLSPRSDPHGEIKGKNILIRLKNTSLSSNDESELAPARQKLHAHRALRPRPHLDDKVVCGWNGMAIGVLATASVVLPNESPVALPSFPVDGRDPAEYLDAAVQAAEFVEKHLWDQQRGRLLRSFCKGPSQVEGFDGDYALMVGGLLDLYAAGGGTKWLAWAYKLQQAMDDLFWDDKAGGYFSTTGQDTSIKIRMKEDQDGAEPAAASVAVANLLRLAAMAPPEAAEKLRQRACDTLAAHQDRLRDVPVALTQMCCSAFLLSAGHMRQVIISGASNSKDVKSLLTAAHAPFCPDKVVIPMDPANKEDVAFWEAHNPDIFAMASSAKDGKATAFVCQNFACRAPSMDPEKVKALLAERAQAGGAKTHFSLPGLKL